mgnify:CR=1 FL=1
MFNRIILSLLVLVLLPLAKCNAVVHLPQLFQSGMVLQRNQLVPVWGTADANEAVKIVFRGKTYTTTADADGKWRIDLPKQKPGGPFEMKINDVTLTDVLVGDVWIVEIHPVAHLVRQVGPLLGVLHDLLAAVAIVVVHADGLADVLLGDAEQFLDAQFDGQTVGVPSGFALHLEALHRLVAAEGIFDAARHDVVDAGHTVRRGRTLKEDERGTALTLGHTLGEDVLAIPLLQHFFVHLGEVQHTVFRKFLVHIKRIKVYLSILGRKIIILIGEKQTFVVFFEFRQRMRSTKLSQGLKLLDVCKNSFIARRPIQSQIHS